MMRESFINTISIDSEPFILRYVLHPSEPIYTVSVINRKSVRPFTMAMINENSWKIAGLAEEKFKAVETRIAEAITESCLL